MLSKKRRRVEPPSIHPRNKYSESPPDFRLLASLYPSFHPYVFYSHNGRPCIDWKDFNASRELTRVLLLHDHSLNWWIPDGQLCPTVPNRSNYIHWIEDLLASNLIGKFDSGTSSSSGERVRGFDVGTGANCIYPLLGASLLGWSFVGTDITDVALEWAQKNVESNPHLSELIEIRRAGTIHSRKEIGTDQLPSSETTPSLTEKDDGSCLEQDVTFSSNEEKIYNGPPVLFGVVRDGEKFDFCMSNPPFFESMEEAGRNTQTSYGGTTEEMVCPGGERAFITQIIEDSVLLKNSFRWFTSMVGRKANLKFLSSKLREVGALVVKTTEFVQGSTARWGLGWSFMSTNRKTIISKVPEKSHHSFVLEGLRRQFGAFHVLKSVESFFLASGASCKCNLSSFIVDVNASNENCKTILKYGQHDVGEGPCQVLHETISDSSTSDAAALLCLRVSVFEQIPGTVLLKGSLPPHRPSPLSGLFSLIFQQMEIALKKELVNTWNRSCGTK